MKLAGKVAIVTGSARGIGRAVAVALIQEGARVVRVDRPGQFDADNPLPGDPNDTIALEHDLAEATSARQIIEATLSRFGGVDVLVNCAQAATQKLFTETGQADWDLAFNTGFWPTTRLMQEAFPALRQSKGSVINFASGAGIEGQPTQAAYAANKEAIRGMSRVVAHEWASDGIRVNIVSPFALSEGVKAYFEAVPEAAEAAIAVTPLGRVGDLATDIAPAIVFLAGPDSQYITGQTLMVDGGQIMLR